MRSPDTESAGRTGGILTNEVGLDVEAHGAPIQDGFAVGRRERSLHVNLDREDVEDACAEVVADVWGRRIA